MRPPGPAGVGSVMYLINVYKLQSFRSLSNFIFILITSVFLPFNFVQCSTAVKPISSLSYNVTQKERLFHMDCQDHYNPNISPDLGDIVFWKNFIFITARNNIFKFYRNSSQFYQFQYAMMLPEFDKCSRPDLKYCLREVKFLFPYTNESMLGCYAHNFVSHFFKLTNSRFENINNTDILANALRKFCSVDSNEETLVFNQGINTHKYFLASGNQKKGFEMERLQISSPSDLDLMRNSTEKIESNSVFGLYPGVKNQIKTNNLQDKSLFLGKSYPVSHFEYNGSVFVTFREPAIEFKDLAEYENIMFSRIAKVCKQDRGSGWDSISPVKYWTSFAKARLICATSEKVTFVLNEVQATFFDDDGFLFGLFDTPYSEMTSSAVCVYDMRTVNQAFAGDHYNAAPFEPKAQRNPDVIKDYKPSECTNRSEDIDIELVDYLQTHPLMQDVVKPVSGAPAFLVHGSNFRLATLTGEKAYWVESGSKLSKIYVLYVGTNKGEILKLVVNLTSHRNSMNTTWLAQWRVFPEDSKKDDNVEIKKVWIDKLTDQLLITTHSQVVAMPKSRCGKSFSTCRKCLQSGDPHCSWDIFTSTCIDFSRDPGSNTSLNAYLTSARASEWCEVMGGRTKLINPEKEATISSEMGGSRKNQDESKDHSDAMDGRDIDGSAAKPTTDTASAVKNGNEAQEVSAQNGKGSSIHSITTPEGDGVSGRGDGGSEIPPISMENEKKSKGSKNRMLTITLVTGIPCIILGVLAGMGILYCYALLKANKHSKVSKSSPNELIYAPITMGKSPSNSSDTAPHPENAYMYQQVYAQFLQVDPQEEKHYSTIGSVPSEHHYAANTLIGAAISPQEVGTLNKYPTLNPAAPMSNDGSFLASSPVGYPSPQNHEGSSMLLDNSVYHSRGLHHHQPPQNVNQSNAANGPIAGSNSLTVLNACSINNLSNSFNPNNHIQNTQNNHYPQHHTVVPGGKINPRMYQQQLQPPNKNSTLAGMCNMPQSVSMINYSHSQLSHPGNLLRDSSQMLTKIPYGSQYKSETKLFQPRPGVNNTYGEDAVSSKLLLFNNNSNKQNTAQQPSQQADNSNFPRIRRPTSVKYKNKNNGKAPSNVDPLYGSSNPRFRSDSLVQNPPPSSTYRSDFELSNNHNLRNGGSIKGNNIKNGSQYPGRTSENPLYGTSDYQSQQSLQTPNSPMSCLLRQMPPQRRGQFYCANYTRPNSMYQDSNIDSPTPTPHSEHPQTPPRHSSPYFFYNDPFRGKGAPVRFSDNQLYRESVAPMHDSGGGVGGGGGLSNPGPGSSQGHGVVGKHVAHRLAAKNRQSPTHNSPKMHLPPSSGVPGPRKLMASTASCRSKQQLPAISGSQDSSTGGRLSSNGALSEAEYMDLEEIPYEGIITESGIEENEPLSIDI